MRCVLPVNHCKWWTVNPAVILSVNEIIMPQIEYEKIQEGKHDNTYHRIVYNTIERLKHEGIVKLSKQYVPQEEKKVESVVLRIKEMVSKGEPSNSIRIIDDLLFAYKYWIGYNKRKLQILDLSLKDDKSYIEKIRQDMKLWQEDIKLLKETRVALQGRKAICLSRLEQIFDITLKNIFAHVHSMIKTAELNQGLPFESLREYEPFFSYFLSSSYDTVEEGYLQDYLCIVIPIAGMRKMKSRKGLIKLIGDYLYIREKLKELESYGWDFEELYRKLTLQEFGKNVQILKKLQREVYKKIKIQRPLEICDYMSLGLATVGVVALSLGQLFGIASLGLALASKGLGEGMLVKTIKKLTQTIKNTDREVSLRDLKAYFYLLDGVRIPLAQHSKDLRSDSCGVSTRRYTARHWREVSNWGS